MIKLFNYCVTDIVVKNLEEILDKEYTEITKEEFEGLLHEYKHDSENEYLWSDEDENVICSLDFGNPATSGTTNCFYKINDLGIYIAEDNNRCEYFYYGDIGDTSQFIDYYLNYCTINNEFIIKSIYKLTWYDESDDCYKAVKDFIKEYTDDEDGKDLIEFHGNDLSCLNQKIQEFVNDFETEDFKIGTYLGNSIYKIKKKLYYLTDDSYVFNTEYHWYLKEVGEKCYEYFEKY
ncbi:hypothetical protein [Tepidibacter hydrothermalis]|uniref:Uncharacterized protein n=1 Tax=Tepidibacter hydrothermalis TaxID=3036126 RepID=A0ABY8EEE2_9FIRM|nr:hypothetical protein [Tepidibacter hydrothermalis]WFD11318.1 hypothetical protein P4S50_04370 [Tepidibacter hydrothermalis]